ncbi:MAG: hypothetical protein QNJ14_05900 [Woeseiaceae bacterium]|nr:hypothetical protein [Woeseiaceae bacterium]
MLKSIKNWLKNRRSTGGAPAMDELRHTGAHPAAPKATSRQSVPRPTPEYVQADADLSGEIETNGPGKNVLIRNRFIREDTGTHETLTILDDSMVDSGEQQGIDPYNTGSFDRSKNWDRRHGK